MEGYMIHIKIEKDDDVAKIISEHSESNYVLAEEHNHIDGHFLVFEARSIVEAIRATMKAEAAKARLAEIDLKSIRSIREWVAKQPDAPEFIKTYEAEAVAERAKLTG